jgi:hypothetical protein
MQALFRRQRGNRIQRGHNGFHEVQGSKVPPGGVNFGRAVPSASVGDTCGEPSTIGIPSSHRTHPSKGLWVLVQVLVMVMVMVLVTDRE